MKAAVFDTHGGPEVLRIDDVPTPEPEAGEVRVSVRACGLNHLDLFVRRGIPGVPPSLPHVGGAEVVGRVDALGPGVTGWVVGDPVIVNPTLFCGACEECLRGRQPLCDRFGVLGEHTWGGLAEYVVVPARNLLALPAGVDPTHAATTPLTFQTAWRALFTQARLRPGESVLVLGGSGGVAVAAIQMAAEAGAVVYAVTSGARKVEQVAALGAHRVFDRSETSFAREVWSATGKRGVDVVVENVGAATWSDSLRALARGGRLVTFGATTGPIGETNINLVFWRQLSIIGSTMGAHADFRSAMRWLAEGKVRPVVDSVIALEDIRSAHERLESGDVFGKLVIRIR